MTCSVYNGFAVLIPTSPLLSILILSTPPVENPRAEFDGWNIPVLLSSLKENDGTAAESLLLPTNCTVDKILPPLTCSFSDGDVVPIPIFVAVVIDTKGAMLLKPNPI